VIGIGNNVLVEVQTRLKTQCRHGSILARTHIVFAAPDHLHRQSYLSGNDQRLNNIVSITAPAKTTTQELGMELESVAEDEE
jgi:hypothetical protein